MEDQYIGKFLDERYEILEKIGSGGMAVVYKARCHRLNRLVAIKILKSDLAQDPDLRRRFHAESQAVAMLSHPNIVSVYDVNHTDNVDYIVMELIEGITLKQYINKKGILNWKEALHFTTQIAKALEHAHSRGIIHRDIKPHNIMILKDGNVKVADFGIARLLTTQNTLTQETLGSVHYISPEQAKGGAADARSDLYSVGVVMYEMLTSRLPFEGDSAVSVAIQHISSIPLMPREINPDIPVGLEEITMKAMDPNLNTRYQSATALLADLEDFRKNPSIRFNYSFVPSMADELDNTRSVPTKDVAAAQRPQRRSSGNAMSRNNVSPKEYRENRKRAGNTTMLVGIFCIVVLLIGIVVFMWKVALKGWLSPEPDERVEVPNFVGSMYNDVIKDPEYTRYYSFSVEYDYSSDYPEGMILEQDPAARRSVTVSSSAISVTLTVSAGKEDIQMPNLVNQDHRLASNQLNALNLDLNIVEDARHDDSVTDGWVIQTIPTAGELLHEGDTVTIIYSIGPDIIEMPDLINKEYRLARNQLEALQLDLNIVEDDQYDDSITEGYVIQTVPAKGELLTKGMTVTIIYSKGPEITYVRVPNLIGLTESTALSRLATRGLLGEKVEEYNSAIPAGQVYFQDYEENEQVLPGTTVKFYVSLGPQPSDQPSVDNPPVDDPGTSGGENEDPNDPGYGEEMGEDGEGVEPNG